MAVVVLVDQLEKVLLERGGPGRHGTAVRMNGHSVIAFNKANSGGGIYVRTSDVILHDHASVTRNVAESTGGGVLLYSWKNCPGMVGQLVTRDQATISKNTPNNVVKRNDVVDCSV